MASQAAAQAGITLRASAKRASSVAMIAAEGMPSPAFSVRAMAASPRRTNSACVLRCATSREMACSTTAVRVSPLLNVLSKSARKLAETRAQGGLGWGRRLRGCCVGPAHERLLYRKWITPNFIHLAPAVVLSNSRKKQLMSRLTTAANATLTLKRIRHGTHGSTKELEQAIRDYFELTTPIRSHSIGPRPLTISSKASRDFF